VDSLIQDLKYAARSIAGSKKFGAIVIATLALGIGANTAVFGVLNAVVLKPLPYDEPERLVRVYQSTGGEDNYLPGPAVVALRDQSRTLDLAAVYTYRAEGADLTDRSEPERVRTMPVGADYFRVLRVHPILGHVFERVDERANARVAVSRRTREMGIALGAPAGSVRSLVVRDGSRLAAIGVGLGFVAAYTATRALRSLLFGVSATEPLIFAVAAGVLICVAMAASWVPARAATRVDPLQAVRD
jgi:putative ABC transport system permease protein